MLDERTICLLFGFLTLLIALPSLLRPLFFETPQKISLEHYTELTWRTDREITALAFNPEQNFDERFDLFCARIQRRFPVFLSVPQKRSLKELIENQKNTMRWIIYKLEEKEPLRGMFLGLFFGRGNHNDFAVKLSFVVETMEKKIVELRDRDIIYIIHRDGMINTIQ